MAVKVQGNEIILSGFVGETFYRDGFTSGDVINALAMVGSEADIRLRINSGGGIATEGAAIYASVKGHKGEVVVIVEGIAASAASLIAMAGDEIEMAPGAVMMIHDPAGFTFGDAAAHQKTIEALNALGDAYAVVYAERSGKTKDEARQIMREESWFDGPAAVAAGFATKAATASNDNKPAEASAFDYRLYAKAPEALVALAQTRGWNARASMAVPTASTPPKESTMSTTPTQPTLQSNPPQNQPKPGAPQTETAADAVARSTAIVEACVAAGVASMASGLISSGKTLDEAKAVIADAGAIRAAVDQARKVNPTIEASLADKFISEGKSSEQARAALLDLIVAKQSPEVKPGAPVDTQPAAAAWDKHVENINARNAA
ncbi:head maturation protease, ClpP-related [Microvirga vignae]|uniref:head maturation protease, ClpP-related n=1 Tax=Microvirga vignae TaxID=1225564 RepID=UPI00069AE694|nr:head maturation protease, ClpP-related [Microvirga vignae]